MSLKQVERRKTFKFLPTTDFFLPSTSGQQKDRLLCPFYCFISWWFFKTEKNIFQIQIQCKILLFFVGKKLLDFSSYNYSFPFFLAHHTIEKSKEGEVWAWWMISDNNWHKQWRCFAHILNSVDQIKRYSYWHLFLLSTNKTFVFLFVLCFTTKSLQLQKYGGLEVNAYTPPLRLVCDKTSSLQKTRQFGRQVLGRKTKVWLSNQTRSSLCLPLKERNKSRKPTEWCSNISCRSWFWRVLKVHSEKYQKFCARL